jgi:hypothetical protein
LALRKPFAIQKREARPAVQLNCPHNLVIIELNAYLSTPNRKFPADGCKAMSLKNWQNSRNGGGWCESGAARTRSKAASRPRTLSAKRRFRRDRA